MFERVGEREKKNNCQEAGREEGSGEGRREPSDIGDRKSAL